MHSDEMSFLGLSNSELFLAEKDSKSIKTEFLLLPTFEFLDQQEELEEGEEFLKKKKNLVSSSAEEMKMSTTSPAGGDHQTNYKLEEDEAHEDGFRTPTSLDHKLRVNYQECPPAPKKPKSLPAAPGAADSRKRKAASSRIFIRIDLSKEIHDLLQVPLDHHQDVATATDLGSKIIKKVRSN